MAIIKESTFPAFSPTGEPLVRLLDNLPSGPMEKTAGIHPEILAYKNQLEPEPGKTYVHILALGAGDYYGPNLNNDHFPWQGLCHDHTKTAHPHMHGYKTFLNAHAFAHHMNKDPEKAYGDVLLSVLNTKMKRVELIVAIDEEKCIRNGGQRTLDKIKAGEYPSTSMGCRVPFDVCSICGHKAKYRSEYCDHMKHSAGKLMSDGRKVFVYNPYPRFFDISFVFIGADRTSFVLEKVAHQKEAMIGGMVGGLVRNQPHMVVGATTGALTSALSAPDGQRVRALGQGALIGGTTGALSKAFGGSATDTLVGSAGLSFAHGRSLKKAVQQPGLAPPPAQTSSLGTMKFAGYADTMMARDMRRKAGVKMRVGKKRVAKKVQRRDHLTIRPLTFSKLKGKQEDARFVMSSEPPPLPEFLMKNGVDIMHGYGKKEEKIAGLKLAEVLKLSDIFKNVQSAPMGKAVPMLVGKDPDMDCGTLDQIAKQPDLGRTLGGLGSAGIVLKPQEFQRVVLMRTGQEDLANKLHASGHTFSPVMPVKRSIRITIQAPEGGIPNGLMDMISNILPMRSALTPFALRRPEMSPKVIKVIRVQNTPMLSKIASLYNGYREDLLLKSEDLVKTAMHTPVLMRRINTVRGGDFLGGGPSKEALMHIPVAYFSHAYWNRCCCDQEMSNQEFAKKFVADNPEIAKYLSLYVAKHSDMI